MHISKRYNGSSHVCENEFTPSISSYNYREETRNPKVNANKHQPRVLCFTFTNPSLFNSSVQRQSENKERKMRRNMFRAL